MNIIATDKAPGAIGPYSQGYEVNGMIYTSGQIPVDPATGNIPEQKCGSHPGSCRKRFRQSGQDHLLPGKYGRFYGVQRSLCKIFCIQTGEKLRGGKGPAQRRALRSGSDRGEIKIRGCCRRLRHPRFFYFTSLGVSSPRSKIFAFSSVVLAMAASASSVKNAWWDVIITLGKDRSLAVTECSRISSERFS